MVYVCSHQSLSLFARALEKKLKHILHTLGPDFMFGSQTILSIALKKSLRPNNFVHNFSVRVRLIVRERKRSIKKEMRE